MSQLVTPAKITRLKKNEVFVFGSNMLGNHAGGAAYIAVKSFGAIQGQADGLQGKSYAIPTLDENMSKVSLDDLKESIEDFRSFALETTSLHFLVTEIGCGIAGFTHSEIAPLFKKLAGLENVSLPRAFVDIINQPIKGYKVTDSNMVCNPGGRAFQFELGRRFKVEGEIVPCSNGFHYCQKLSDCFSYYSFDTSNRVFEILDHGTTVTEGDKSCTSEIEFVRELSWLEVLELVNTGKGNSGFGNAGNRNAGNYNAGNRNAGNSNAGNDNAGDRNAGNYNAGNRNAGNRNAGNYNAGYSNAGNDNAGNDNAGYSNAGNDNAGNDNAGYSNAGNDNAGNYNAGNRNAGNYNAGNRNAGYSNAGNDNAGNRNAGYSNAGNDNAGYSNAGNDNAGNYNAGNRNAGNYNAGNRNAGYSNAGNDNAGNRNAGYSNAGNDNAGYSNAGNDNAGNYNAGNRNAGNYNAGNRNAGYSNAGNDNAGAFNNLQANYVMFNKTSNWTYEDFISSKAYQLLSSIDTTLWVPSYAMSNDEMKDHPYYVTTGGYVKHLPYKEAFTNAWNNWGESAREAFTSLPNFDADVFEDITGVKISQ